MNENLPDDEAITVPVPSVQIMLEERHKALPVTDVTHVVVQLSDKRLGSIMDWVGVPCTHIFQKPWPFWFYIGKIVSKAFFDDERQLEWLNTVRVRNREFIAFTNKQNVVGQEKLQVIEVDFPKPQQPGEDNLKLFWKPARGIIVQRVQGWLDYAAEKSRIAAASAENDVAGK